jgi:folate-binding protein YgfZ
MVDMIVAENPPADGGGYFLDVPRALAPMLVQRLNFYKLRAKVTVEDVSETLGVLAIWDGDGRIGGFGLAYPDPRLAGLGTRYLLAPQLAGAAASAAGAPLVDASGYEAHRIALGVPRGGVDFAYGDAFPHETDMDQLGGVDFDKGCFVGQEVVSRIEHRGSARTRVVPVAFAGAPPVPGTAVLAGDRSLGTMGSGIPNRGLAALRLDRVEEALAGGIAIIAGVVELRPVKPPWARFHFPGDVKAAE